jgi:hypothetical protein
MIKAFAPTWPLAHSKRFGSTRAVKASKLRLPRVSAPKVLGSKY